MSEQIKAIRLSLTWDNAQDILAQIEEYYANNPKGEVVIRTYTHQLNVKAKLHNQWKESKGHGYFDVSKGRLVHRQNQKSWVIILPTVGLWLA